MTNSYGDIRSELKAAGLFDDVRYFEKDANVQKSDVIILFRGKTLPAKEGGFLNNLREGLRFFFFLDALFIGYLDPFNYWYVKQKEPEVQFWQMDVVSSYGATIATYVKEIKLDCYKQAYGYVYSPAGHDLGSKAAVNAMINELIKDNKAIAERINNVPLDLSNESLRNRFLNNQLELIKKILLY